MRWGERGSDSCKHSLEYIHYTSMSTLYYMHIPTHTQTLTDHRFLPYSDKKYLIIIPLAHRDVEWWLPREICRLLSRCLAVFEDRGTTNLPRTPESFKSKDCLMSEEWDILNTDKVVLNLNILL